MNFLNPFNAKEVADKILEEWDDICKELNIPHFLWLGTCLGFYRDGGYIEGDEDLDVGVLVDNQGRKKLAEKLVKHGFTTEQEPYKNKHWHKNGIFLDIWSFFHDWTEFLESFDQVTYKGRIYNVPHPVEEYLEKEYGNWGVPEK